MGSAGRVQGPWKAGSQRVVSGRPSESKGKDQPQKESFLLSLSLLKDKHLMTLSLVSRAPSVDRFSKQ